MSLSVDVIYNANLKPGDLFAGWVVPDAPTRPCQPCAAALRVTAVETVTGGDGKKWVHPQCAIGAMTPLPYGGQCMVIRGAE